MKLVKVNILSAQCTMSDDEGAGNLADVDRFNIGFEASDKIMAPVSSTLYNFSTSGDVTIDVDDLWDFEAPGSSKKREGAILFQDWETAQLRLFGGAREYDAGSGDEYSSGDVTLSPADMEGEKTIVVDGDDVRFDVKLNVTVQSLS